MYDFTLQIPYYGAGTGKVSYSAISVTAARAGCDSPKGAVQPTFPYSELTKNLVGTWVNCGTRDPGSLLGHDGIALHPDGSFEVLDADPSDHFSPATGCNLAGLWGLFYSFAMPQGGQLTFYVDSGITPTIVTIYQGQPRQLDFDFSTFALAQ